MVTKTEAEKLNELADQLEELKKKVIELRDEFEAIDQEKLDNEEDDEWDSDVVNEYIMDLDTAISAMEGEI